MKKIRFLLEGVIQNYTIECHLKSRPLAIQYSHIARGKLAYTEIYRYVYNYSKGLFQLIHQLDSFSYKQSLLYVGNYNGNVSSMSWGFSTSSTAPVYTYHYSYDDLDCLKTASYSVKNVNPVFYKWY